MGGGGVALENQLTIAGGRDGGGGGGHCRNVSLASSVGTYFSRCSDYENSAFLRYGTVLY